MSYELEKEKAYSGSARAAVLKGDAIDLKVILTSAAGQGPLHAITMSTLAQLATCHGQAECLRVISKFGPWLDGTSTECAAIYGNLSLLRLAHELGDRLTSATALQAGFRGHVDCLAFALRHDCPVDVDVLRAAVSKGHRACVELLVAHGLPRHPYIHADTKCCSRSEPGSRPTGPFGPAQMRCLTLILDKGRPIHTGTLILAAKIGDVDCVRFLHSRGVGLWDQATVWDDEPYELLHYLEDEDEERDELPPPPSCVCSVCQLHWHVGKKIMTLPSKPQRAPHMLEAMWYGWASGAPLSPAMEAMFMSKRRSTRALLCCFHVATRLSRRRKGPRKQKAVWDVMGRLPADLVDKILLLADLEIPETLRCPLPKESSLKVHVKKPTYPQWPWGLTTDVWVCAPSPPSNV